MHASKTQFLLSKFEIHRTAFFFHSLAMVNKIVRPDRWALPGVQGRRYGNVVWRHVGLECYGLGCKSHFEATCGARDAMEVCRSSVMRPPRGSSGIPRQKWRESERGRQEGRERGREGEREEREGEGRREREREVLHRKENIRWTMHASKSQPKKHKNQTGGKQT